MVAPKEPKPGGQTQARAGTFDDARVAVGKLTRIEGGGWEVDVDGQQFLCTPSFEACFKGPPRLTKTLLDPLMGTSRAEVERRIQARIAAGQQQVCGTLPLGGVYFGSKAGYDHARAVDEFQIQLRVIQNMETSLPAAIQAALMKLEGASDAHILKATDAMVALSNIVGAIAGAARARETRSANKPPSSPPTSAPLAPKPKPAATEPPPPAPQPAHDPFTKVSNPVVITLRYTDAMKKNPSDAAFFKACIEFAQQALQLRTARRATGDAAARRDERATMKQQGSNISDRDASHAIDSVINLYFEPGSGAFYFANKSVNRSLGAQLQPLGKLPPGTPILIKFEPGFAQGVPATTPPTSW
jgi:hypothetical protein